MPNPPPLEELTHPADQNHHTHQDIHQAAMEEPAVVRPQQVAVEEAAEDAAVEVAAVAADHKCKRYAPNNVTLHL